MTLSQEVTKRIIKKLISGEDYRIEIVTLINAEFLNYAIEFFKKIVDAKFNNNKINIDWYKEVFLNPKLSAKEIAINSGLNKKTIHNMYNTSRKEIVIDASNEHYDTLYESIKNLVDSENEIELNLTIKFKGISVDLNVSESLIVINALAVKRAELRGGLWSTAGKRVEKPLMLSLCKLFNVSEVNYSIKEKGKKKKTIDDFEREIDFYLKNNGILYKCEVKLMGKGNPEGADAVIARDSKLFIADKLSDTNKLQLNSLKVHWVELRSEEGYKKFANILEILNIPYKLFTDNIDNSLEAVFKEIFV